MYELTTKDLRRFWAKIEKRRKNQCWPWKGAKSPKGYGLFRLPRDSRKDPRVVASRIACFLRHGPPPPGKPMALHTCDNPACCNGEHTYWGTAGDNISDAIARGRATPLPPVLKRERHPMARLIESEIAAIRAAVGADREIAARFGISRGHCSAIRRRKFWP